MIFSANYWEFEQGRGFMVLEPTREADNAIGTAQMVRLKAFYLEQNLTSKDNNPLSYAKIYTVN